MTIDKSYKDFIVTLKEKIAQAKNKTIFSVNKTMISLYFEIGKEIVEKQESLGWGKSIVEQMAKDLQKEFGAKSGYSTQNLWYMRQFYMAYRENLNLQQRVGEIPWGHNILVFSKCKTVEEQIYYVDMTVKEGWSRKLLLHHIKSNLYSRDSQALKQHNFDKTLPASLSALANEMIKSEYNLSFLDVTTSAKEYEVEQAIITNIKSFLLELGYGFSFIGNQYKITLEESEYFIDLLFFHRQLNALVAVELKIGKFKPEYAGKMNFYLNLLNDKVKMPHENPSIGIILCTDKKGVEVEYALQNIVQPMGVSTYSVNTELPQELEGILPAPQALAKTLENCTTHKETNEN
jgi:predicted nuclease of restriction endonuclease-like (RecB) superfamily